MKKIPLVPYNTIRILNISVNFLEQYTYIKIKMCDYTMKYL